jgi:hypothetical protein
MSDKFVESINIPENGIVPQNHTFVLKMCEVVVFPSNKRNLVECIINDLPIRGRTTFNKKERTISWSPSKNFKGGVNGIIRLSPNWFLMHGIVRERPDFVAPFKSDTAPPPIIPSPPPISFALPENVIRIFVMKQKIVFCVYVQERCTFEELRQSIMSDPLMEGVELRNILLLTAEPVSYIYLSKDEDMCLLRSDSTIKLLTEPSSKRIRKPLSTSLPTSPTKKQK